MQLLAPDTKVRDPTMEIYITLVEIEEVFVRHARTAGSTQFDTALDLDGRRGPGRHATIDAEHVPLKEVAI